MTKLGKPNYLVASSAMALVFAAAQPAYAQSSQEAEDSDPNIIIVTATQRSSNVQDIPVAVTAVTPIQLERQGVQDITTLTSVSSSINLQSSQTETQGTTIRIRGVGTTGNNIGLESAVGIFIDGVYQSRPGVALGDLLDLEQLEVLRGPQGTLFGRNTTAGALVVRTKKPDLGEVGGFVNATYGNYDAISAQAGINLPVVQDELAFRFSGAYRKRDGFLTNSVGDQFNDRDRFMLRGQFLWEPNSDISLRVIADYQKTNEVCCDAVLLSPGLLAAQPAALAMAFPNGFGPDALRNRRSNGDTGVENDAEQWGVSAELNWDFGGAKFTYIGAYRDFTGDFVSHEFNRAQVIGSGGLPGVNPLANLSTDKIETWTHEARLQGSAFDDVLDWLIGAYYSDETILEDFNLGLGSDYQAFVGNANGAPGAFSGATPILNFIANGVFAPIDSNGSFANNRFHQDGKSISVFTHNIFNITDKLSITLGARYVDDKKDGQFEQLSASNPACQAAFGFAGAVGAPNGAANVTTRLTNAGVPLADAQGLVANAALFPGGLCFPFAVPAGIPGFVTEFGGPGGPFGTFDDDEFIYTAQAAFKATDDVLIYGGFTHGYKAGGFNLDATASLAGQDPRFASEEIDAYEIGVKSTLLDGRARANVAFFYSKLANFQVLNFTGTRFETFNVDQVSSKGVEVELFAQWSDYISNTVSVTYTDAGYGNNCDRGGTIAAAATLCGNPLSNAPEFVGLFGMTYDGPINSSDWNMLANVNVRYESSRDTAFVPIINPATGGVDPIGIQKANMKVNARLGFTTPDERFSFELWGNNLTDEQTRSISFNTPLVAASASAFLDAPRTYGATIRAKF